MSSDGQKIITGVYNGRLYISSNGGTSWSETKPIGEANANWYDVAISGDGQKIIAGIDNGRLYISSNGGTSWSETQPAGAVNKSWHALSISTDNNTIIAGAYGGRLYISSNSGTSWSETQPAGNIDGNWQTINKLSNEKIIVGSYNGRLYLSQINDIKITNPQPILYTNNAYNFLGTFTDLDYNSETTYKYSFGYNYTNSFNGSEIYIDTNQNLDYAQTEYKDFNLSKTFDNTDVAEDLYSFFTVHRYYNSDYNESFTGWSSTTFDIVQAEIILNIYDENTLAPISTVKITDSNGTTYDTNATGYINLGQLSGDKSFTISKTGYDSRKLDFFFKVSDYYDWNFALSQSANSEDIDFLVKDSNNDLWSEKYLWFSKDGNVIGSYKTTTTGTVTANLLPAGDYNASLYDENGILVQTYQKTVVTVSKPKDEKTFALISPYDIYVGGLLSYSVTNQTAATNVVNIFGGTTSTYDFSIVDYNVNPTDKKYITRSFNINNPFGENYNTAYPIQPYLVKAEDGIIPIVYTIDSIRRPVPNVLIKIYKVISSKLELIEMKTTSSTGRLSYSAYPLDKYIFETYFNGTLVGTYNFEPRSTDEITYLLVDLYSDIEFGYYPETYISWNLQDIYDIRTEDINASAIIYLKSVETSLNFTGYTISINQGGSTLSTQTYPASGTEIVIEHIFDSNVLDGNIYYANIVVDASYDFNGSSYTQRFRISVGIQQSKTNLFTIMQSIPNETGRLFSIILAILITIGILSFITLQVQVDERVISVLGMAILGIFVIVGWISSGISVVGVDIMTYAYILGCVTVVYFMTLRR